MDKFSFQALQVDFEHGTLRVILSNFFLFLLTFFLSDSFYGDLWSLHFLFLYLVGLKLELVTHILVTSLIYFSIVFLLNFTDVSRNSELAWKLFLLLVEDRVLEKLFPIHPLFLIHH